ncbi:hypothetical protein [Vibrio mexicanus]|uniref:hypothetical protein n=1 Tax=Vibrio mexicanus TaxID=1004326 RepID=UPI00063CCF2E|nr:hypothetical protein [Vibrio mexicanus]
MNSTTTILVGLTAVMGTFALEVSANESMDISAMLPIAFNAQSVLATSHDSTQPLNVEYQALLENIEVGGHYISLKASGEEKKSGVSTSSELIVSDVYPTALYDGQRFLENQNQSPNNQMQRPEEFHYPNQNYF